MINYEVIVNGYISNNTYLIYKGSDCIIVDPSFDFKLIDKTIKKLNLNPIAIILTHAHYDHIASCDLFVDKYHIDLYCGKTCARYIKDPKLNLSKKDFTQRDEVIVKSPTKIVEVGELVIQDFKFNVMKTYGHSKACMTYIIDDLAITGDFIFKGTVGRTDLFDSSVNAMNESLMMFAKLDRNLKILPGHGECTTLISELQNNPYLNRYYNE